jgi:murein DD-endopeptidase MepM/ murein hydrolase activator NlpD
MKLSDSIASFFRNLRTRQRISVRDPHNGRENWYIFLSPLNVLTALVALVVVLFVGILSIIAFTPALDLVPGYQGIRARNELIRYTLRLDSLEGRLTLWNDYYENLTRIMDGKAPLAQEDPTPDSLVSERSDIARIPEDDALRRQMEGAGPYGLQQAAAGRGNEYPEMYPPVKGVVVHKFDPKGGRYGVDIATAENQPVMALMDGTVINAVWTPTEGYIIHILHPGGFLSAVLHNASLTKKTGDRVYSGEVVAYTGSAVASGADAGYAEVQLWVNGVPVDPENYMIF